MTDVFSKRKRSEVMSQIRAKNTKPELLLRKIVSAEVYKKGLRYKIHYKRAPGSPDLAFVSFKIAIFVDGSFWHGKDFAKRKKKLPKVYWRAKIEKNIKRDKRVNARLRRLGWKVIRIWDTDLNKRPLAALGKISRAIEARIAQDRQG